MKKILFLFLAIMISACATNKPQNKSAGFNGIWEGAGVQDDNSSWTIKVTIVGQQYSIDYPSLGCGGKLSLISKQSNRIEFHEKLSYGESKCIDNGKTVLIKVGNNSAQYEWFYKNGKKGATGTLTRK